MAMTKKLSRNQDVISRYEKEIITYFRRTKIFKNQKVIEKKYEKPNNSNLISNFVRQEVFGMKIKVQYISLVKSFTNRSQDEFELRDGAIVSELLDKIAETYGKPFTHEVYEKGQTEMKPNFVAMINGVLMGQLKGMNTSLKEGDNMILMTLMTGG